MQNHRHGNSRQQSTVIKAHVTQHQTQASPNDKSHRDQDCNELKKITGRLVFAPLDAELFNSVAREKATLISNNQDVNKPSQVRKFYDELCMWETKINQEPTRFNDYLPFILMLNAKLAYAKGRKLVDDNFVKLIGDCLKQVTNPETLKIFKLFFEAFLGFYKELRPNENN